MRNGRTPDGSKHGEDHAGNAAALPINAETNGAVSPTSRRGAQGAAGRANGLEIFTQLLVLTAPGESEVWHPLLPEGVSLLELVSVEPGALRLRDRNGGEMKAPSVPPLCIGLVSRSQSGLEALNEAVKSFPDLGAFRHFTPRLVDPSAGALGLLLATDIVRRLREQAAQTTRLAREQATLRATYEHVQNAFAELENFVAWSGLQPVRLAFENLPDEAYRIGGAKIASIRQLLPVNVLGLCTLELHLGSDADDAPRGFVATLATVEDRFEHARWEFGPKDAKPGWMMLPLPSAIIGLQRTAELVLRPLDEAAGLPMFSLGAPQPLAAFRALTPSRGGPAASLALRAWTGLPGARPPFSSPDVPRQTAIGPRAHEARIPFSLIRNVKRVVGDWKPNFDAVEPRPDIRGFLCHPAPGGAITSCILDGLNRSEPSLLSAQATVLNEQSSAVEFGIAFSSLSERQVETLMAQGFRDVGGADFVFTGWRRVVHGGPAVLALILPVSAGRVFFATRMADQAPQWFGWATFGDLRQVFLGATEPGEVSSPAASPEGNALAADEIDSTEIGDAVVGDCLDRSAAVASSIDPNSTWLSQIRGMGFDPTTPGIPCAPPNSGIALRRLPAIEIRSALKFEARPRVANAEAPTVEFGMAISDLGAGDLLLRVNTKPRSANDSHFVFSGWRRVKSGDEPNMVVQTNPLSIDRANVYLMTRFAGKVQGTTKALAFFSELAVGASGSDRA